MLHPLNAYRKAIDALDLTSKLSSFPASLLMRTGGPWSSYYAPFEHVNRNARIVLVGITPGLQQAENALRALQAGLRGGLSDEEALSAAKQHASFSGRMRANLIAMLDSIGLSAQLGIESATDFFGARSDLVHHTSVLRFPIAFKGKNYSGRQRIAAHSFLREELHRWFEREIRELPRAIFFPLGSAATAAMNFLTADRMLSPSQVLEGLPHPSPANCERIDYFLGRKPRAAVSKKVNADRLDGWRTELRSRVATLSFEA